MRANTDVAAGFLGQKRVHLLRVLWESPPSPSLRGNMLLGTETSCASFSEHRNCGYLVCTREKRLAAGYQCCRQGTRVSSGVEGIKIRESVGWNKASGQLCSVCLPRQVVHKDLVLLSVALLLLVFNQIIDGCWYWLNS